ncbi:hypothetical protein OGAPHI_001402 [Ogataea philodendri]|uniref:Uncharacterized protein n=1 Tax=Ogataea philodendri TaxID=1378263 RepID=A0A9P8PCI3_9ASCO|nr:uncharacterized protein OGAPHI_001402 [Ogataea philodendri]KAH3669281.1 hypothetical protein OGAPHI_001402 [Ogataea philodendri]
MTKEHHPVYQTVRQHHHVCAHAVLVGQFHNAFWILFAQNAEQRPIHATDSGLWASHQRWQLEMVSNKHKLVCEPQRAQTHRHGHLRRLVDDAVVKVLSMNKHCVLDAETRRGHDVGFEERFLEPFCRVQGVDGVLRIHHQFSGSFVTFSQEKIQQVESGQVQSMEHLVLVDSVRFRRKLLAVAAGEHALEHLISVCVKIAHLDIGVHKPTVCAHQNNSWPDILHKPERQSKLAFFVRNDHSVVFRQLRSSQRLMHRVVTLKRVKIPLGVAPGYFHLLEMGHLQMTSSLAALLLAHTRRVAPQVFLETVDKPFFFAEKIVPMAKKIEIHLLVQMASEALRIQRSLCSVGDVVFACFDLHRHNHLAAIFQRRLDDNVNQTFQSKHWRPDILLYIKNVGHFHLRVVAISVSRGEFGHPFLDVVNVAQDNSFQFRTVNANAVYRDKVLVKQLLEVFIDEFCGNNVIFQTSLEKLMHN